ncbi:MAG: peroxidase [Blastocatellia bacterium]|nr:MAG: peroxidase [Blastocatellia bacterium]
MPVVKHANCLAPSRRQPSTDSPLTPSSYGRLFPDLPSFSADDAFLFALGRAGGLCDCQSDVDDAASLGCEAAGWPFFGQFVAHDITADRSTIRHGVDPRELRNARSPQLNLECLYGDGPVGQPFLFRRDDPAKLLLGSDGGDVQRNAEGTAIIADPRNDSHVLMSQMHLAFARAHNAFVDEARAAGVPDPQLFATAARELRWHYQSVVTREFLPRLVGDDLTRMVLAGDRRVYRPDGVAFIPLEFADAAYRYGHSQIRQRYQLREAALPVPLFPDLVGFTPVAAANRVDWATLFDVPGRPPAQRAKKIDGRLVHWLIVLPVALTGATEVEEFHSLAVRDLERGEGVGLPSGEAIARALGEQPLTADEVGAAAAGWHGDTPLWYYVLREADVRCGGDRLGPVGGRIVAEVLAGLLANDETSVLHAPAEWRPHATLADLLTRGGDN